ncbi:hypothetical protein BD413DRAFT_632491 [Trametes elegans]|nr:hypothetical protein BD413DRAFT_632491 [Trametes elegans]
MTALRERWHGANWAGSQSQAAAQPPSQRSLRTSAPAQSPTAVSPTSPASADRDPHPTTTSTATSPTSDPDPARPLSPPAPAEADSAVLKAVRAYERDRQRAKRTKERAERERERQQRADGRPARQRDAPGPGHRASAAAPDASDDAALTLALARVGAGVKGARARGDGHGHGRQPRSVVNDIIADVVEREGRVRAGLGVVGGGAVEVHLEQLVKPGRTRRSKAGEFELVPGMPVVIALDDAVGADGELELDEPWEHISADELDEKRVEPPSYATVVASTA